MEERIIHTIKQGILELYGTTFEQVQLEPTRDDIPGDFTFVVFPVVKWSKKNPEATAHELGQYIQTHCPGIESYQVIKGFLNVTLTDAQWSAFVSEALQAESFGHAPAFSAPPVLIEYSSPNTNKPLHLGHIRNNLLGYSVSQLLKANGHKVITCNLINDRGIHICKSMLAWQKFGNGETPESSGIKGDHLVGKYYVWFDKVYKSEVQALIADGYSEDEAEKHAPLMLEAQQMLRDWEAGNEQVLQLWRTMNDWVYAGFSQTYEKLGVSFDAYYYESQTYLLGKSMVHEGLEKGVFYQKEDGSVWIDLTSEGLDHKLLLRADGTSVYITQDVGTAELKYTDFGCDTSIYVVGNEQDYHFKVLQAICRRLGKPYAKGIFHLSYGMVELPEGKMKSREGTVVDADDLIQSMIDAAREATETLGKANEMDDSYLQSLYHIIGMGALKYFLLKVDPKKKMLFNPAESIDMHGNTGPFIQYTYARIQSILRQNDADYKRGVAAELLTPERKLIKQLYAYPKAVKEAGRDLSPGIIANYTYDLAKAFNHFYHECPILKEADEHKRILRIQLAALTAYVIQSGFGLLGINVPEKM